ncbi:SixA phosphatase family protein [Gracilimonas sp. Q87]|uniref:SixA phosphatase family protein n=1 Tax=Gracilimonas sp. Q87 TaxID=3384766 RepID=UPI00398447DE
MKQFRIIHESIVQNLPTIIENITSMRTLLFIIISLLMPLEITAQNTKSSKSDDETVLILTRHAEKIKTENQDPSLSEAGKKRTIKLLTLLQNYDTLNAVYSTEYNRTKETAQPVAEYFKLPVTIYNPGELKNLKSQFLEKHQGETVLIVGHSNTTPDLINVVMGEERVDQFDENDYSNMYIIKLRKGESPVLQHYIY